MCALAVREIDNLESLRTGWLELWKSSSTATPFQSPDWLIPWWKHFGAGRLCVLAMHEGARLVGVAPLFVCGEHDLRLIGTGNTDYLDVLIDDRVCEHGIARMFAHLCKLRYECDFENLAARSTLLSMSTCTGFREQVEEEDCCPVLSLAPSVEGFINGLPKHLRQNLSYQQRKLVGLGEVKIECAREENFSELFEAFLRLHERRWRMNNMPGVLCDENVQSFLREATKGLLSHDALRLYGLRINDRIVASLCGFHHASRTYYYLSGFDPEFKQFGPGTILVAHAITEAIRERAKEFDFLRGREEYKYRWGAVDRPIYRKHLKLEQDSHDHLEKIM